MKMKLEEFLVKAKIEGWASGKNKEKTLKDGTKEIIYKKEPYEYIDRWNGSNIFMGREIVLKEKSPFWGMYYYGTLNETGFDKKEFNQFLKESLKNIDKNFPFRGPLNFKSNNFEYINKPVGELMNFQGNEFIKFNGENIYRLCYGGGSIKK